MDSELRKAVRERAQSRCEYCQLPAVHVAIVQFQIEHIIARQHGGKSVLGNLAYSYHRCNLHKGPNLAGIDPITNDKVWLFNPRRHKWQRHFRWDGPALLGRTAIGRATINVLKVNEEDRLDLRQALIGEGLFFPE